VGRMGWQEQAGQKLLARLYVLIPGEISIAGTDVRAVALASCVRMDLLSLPAQPNVTIRLQAPRKCHGANVVPAMEISPESNRRGAPGVLPACSCQPIRATMAIRSPGKISRFGIR